MIAKPAQYFDFPPYRAELFSSLSGWSGVMNKYGVNCLTFVKDDGRVGAPVTTFEHAQRLAEEWNTNNVGRKEPS